MRYKLFGQSGLRVSELCLGTLTFGDGARIGASHVGSALIGTPREESRAVFDAFVERGGNFIDTANKYSDGESEQITGEFIGNERDRFVVATKFSLAMRPGDPNSGGNHRKSIVQSLEASLRRLKTEYIDLYWLHQWDFTTPIDEVMRTLDDQVRAGKVLYVGISDAPAWIASRSNMLAELRGWSPYVGLQIEYSLIERTPERELLPMAQALDMGVALWGVIGGGVLSGKYHRAADPQAPADSLRATANQARVNERNLRIAREVEAVAQDYGRSSTQIALNWVRQRSPQMFPIIGARTQAQIRENLGCLDFALEEAALRRLDEASAISLGFPHEFLARERILEQRFGGLQRRLDNHRPLTHLA